MKCTPACISGVSLLVFSIFYFTIYLTVGIYGSMNNNIWTVRDCYLNSTSPCLLLDGRQISYIFQVLVDPIPAPSILLPYNISVKDCLGGEFEFTQAYRCELEDKGKKIVNVIRADYAGPLFEFGFLWFGLGLAPWITVFFIWSGMSEMEKRTEEKK